MCSGREGGSPPEVTTPPIRRTRCRAGPSCCCTVLDSLFAEATHDPATRRPALPQVTKTTAHRELGDELIEMPASVMLLISTRFRRPRHSVRRRLFGGGRPAGITERLARGFSGQRCHRHRCIRVRPGSCLHSLHEANESHYPVVEDNAVGRYHNQRRSRCSHNHDTNTRNTDRTTGRETERRVYSGFDR